MNKLYIDMDGVVADFNEYAFRVHGFAPEVEFADNEWNQIAKNERLYRDLKKTPYADELVEYCRHFGKVNNYSVFFLTAVPKSNRLHWAFTDKVGWGRIHFPDIPVHFGPFSKDKHVHCKAYDILIDDRMSNIIDWRNANGVGILHETFEKTIDELRKISHEYLLV